MCNGRALDERGQPIGEPCGRTLIVNRGNLHERARAAGWRIGPILENGTRDAMCPRCARPDPDLTKTLRELTR